MLFETSEYNKVFKDFDLLIKYKGYVTGKGEMYQTAIYEFLKFIEKRAHGKLEVSRDLMISYYNHLLTRPNKRNGGKLAQNTVKHHMFGIRIFFDMLLEMDILESVPYIPKFTRGHVSDLDILDQNEIRELYQLAKNTREKAFLSACYGCALRRSELRDLNLDDFKYNESYLIVRKGKGGKRREVPLSDKVKEDLYKYVRFGRPKFIQGTTTKNNAFFVKNNGKRMDGQNHYRLLKSIIKRSKNEELLEKQISLHSLRRSIATHLIENGADIYFVKSFFRTCRDQYLSTLRN